MSWNHNFDDFATFSSAFPFRQPLALQSRAVEAGRPLNTNALTAFMVETEAMLRMGASSQTIFFHDFRATVSTSNAFTTVVSIQSGRSLTIPWYMDTGTTQVKAQILWAVESTGQGTPFCAIQTAQAVQAHTTSQHGSIITNTGSILDDWGVRRQNIPAAPAGISYHEFRPDIPSDRVFAIGLQAGMSIASTTPGTVGDTQIKPVAALIWNDFEAPIRNV